ncbi:MAG: MBL fold metallo-hydrolase [Pseudorhodoplanes sp.]
MSDFNIRFWGVRGSIARPGPETVRYGGNTSCLEVRCGTHLIIFDGGTGVHPLGNALVRDGTPLDADIFLSHCHLDHIAGLPFFSPFFLAKNRFRLWAGNLLPTHNIEGVMRTMMSSPLFPIPVDTFHAEIDYRDFRAGAVLRPRDGMVIRTAALNHPDGATGYRLEFDGRVLAYLTDMENTGKFPSTLIELARDADLLICDATYTDAEIAAKAGWGHSTWRQGQALADAAAAKTLCLFHHDPDHDDVFMDGIAREAMNARPGTIVAREGATIRL